MTFPSPRPLLGLAALGAGLLSTAVHAQECRPVERQPITQELIALLEGDFALRNRLQASIAAAQRVNADARSNPVQSLEDYYDYIDALVTYDPRNIETGIERSGSRVSMTGDAYCNWNILDLLTYGYFLIDQQLTTDPRGTLQFMAPGLAEWMGGMAQAWGDYLETPDSARYVPSFTKDPYFGDWYCPDGPYETFQAFFTRELCPETFPSGSRPVAGLDDPQTVVSIGDSTPAGAWPIGADGKLVTDYDTVGQSGVPIKGILYNDVHLFVAGKSGETVLAEFGDIDPARFNGGTFTHQFLNVNNYHRLHLPVSGKLVYMRHFKAATRLKAAWKPATDANSVGYYDPRDTADWQFGQTRLVLGIETEDHGVVIAAPMGMAQVSAIELRDWVKEGAQAEKGWEFANFAFGGSDFVLIFEPDAGFTLTAPQTPAEPPGAGFSYATLLQGARFGCLGATADCSAERATPEPWPGYGGAVD